MKVALYGYGRMGRAIAEVCGQRGHEVVHTVNATNAGEPPRGVDVAIEFSLPTTALDNMRLCLENKVPVVVGTTGWYDHLPEVRSLVASSKGTLLWASNFSIGVNLFFRLNRDLAALMNAYDNYHVQVDEVHHQHKLDAPSGTAITLARDIDLTSDRYSGWEAGRSDRRTGAVPIVSERIGEVPGKHSVTWRSEEDRLTITHEAFGRTGFAVGAVVAAEWLADPARHRQGLFTMDDVMNGNR
ncbi:MAG: 4-hydroxy-tetrahydrodipicolinate reductase [Flavobacteriales bacterium]|nr:4-hydroxy-tetrahydrodipicolinate reductase [Flavobacteriales bacterium]